MVSSPHLKVIPQKKKIVEQFFKISLNCSLPISVSKNAIKKIVHGACLRDMRSQTFPIYTWTGTDHARHFVGSRFILRYLEARDFKVTFEKNLLGKESPTYGTIWYIIWGEVTQF